MPDDGTAYALCLLCPSGSFMNASGATACVPCGVMTVRANPIDDSLAAAPNATTCVTCLPGQVTDSLNTLCQVRRAVPSLLLASVAGLGVAPLPPGCLANVCRCLCRP